jgi:cellobiose-specific phosphotransferase system component IIA
VINNLVLIHVEDHLRVTRIHSPLSSRHLEVSRSFR